MKIAVLGAGLVGAPMAVDLAKQSRYEVTLADIDPLALEKVKDYSILTQQIDLNDEAALKAFIKPFDLAISAVPGFMGFNTLKRLMEAGKNVVDIAFFPEDPFLLTEIAQKNKVTAIVDCGVAPGMSHILTGYAASQMDEIEKVRIYVGGLPQIRTWPYEYKAVFSPVDVIEEYTRPARVVENGAVVEKEALSEPELLHFEGVGTLEAFNSDGLRTLTQTIPAQNMAEKTLRYPGHIELMKVLRHSGFFDKNELDVKGIQIRPLDVTAKLLLKDWKLRQGEKDLTVMKVSAEGKKNRKTIHIEFNLFDVYDETNGVHSMARVTGYTATVVAGLLAEGTIKQNGLIVPEYLGRDKDTVTAILKGLEQRGVHYSESISLP